MAEVSELNLRLKGKCTKARIPKYQIGCFKLNTVNTCKYHWSGHNGGGVEPAITHFGPG